MHTLDDLYAMARLEDAISTASFNAGDTKSVHAACERRNGLMNLIYAHPDNRHSRLAISAQIITGISGNETQGKDGGVVPPHGSKLDHYQISVHGAEGVRTLVNPDLPGALDDLHIILTETVREATITRIDKVGETEYKTVVLRFNGNGVS